MRHLIFDSSTSATYPVALLIKATSFNKQQLLSNYTVPLQARGLQTAPIAFTLEYPDTKKVPGSTFIKEYLAKLLPVLAQLGVEHLYVADSPYFKVLTGKPKADIHFGYVLPCRIKGYEHFKVILGVNHQALIFNPTHQSKLDLSLDTLIGSTLGTYQAIGTGIIHSAVYPRSLSETREALQALHRYQHLTCDIEAFSLGFWKAGIGTISFAWTQHCGIAFPVDWHPCNRGVAYADSTFGFQQKATATRELLKEFFESYTGTITWHNAAYDVEVIIYNLWMNDLNDTEGLLQGLEVMTRNFEDTKIVAYLATNSTAESPLGLKFLAHEFAGNWAVDEIKDICRIPLPELLQYNLIDALSTWYVKNTLTPIMIQDNQEEIYHSLMLPTQKLLIQMELTGMPLSAVKVQEVKDRLTLSQVTSAILIEQHPVVQTVNLLLRSSAMDAANAKLVKKVHPLEKFDGVTFKASSPVQVRRLLYEIMGLPVLDLTETKLPSTKEKTREKLINHTDEPAYKDLIGAMINYGKVGTILENFIPAFEKAISKNTDPIASGVDTVWLRGNFNLGGTISNRLSSSKPNLTNIPASEEDGKFGKVIKECFVAPEGWLFCGADFNSLEDMISALQTRDPNKLKVYTDGYDGHCLRAYAYFPEQLPGIVDTLESINSIKTLYSGVRKLSKTPTFLLTYGGTYHGLMHNLGWDKARAKKIEKGYHDLYKVSDDYVQARLKQASIDGYVDVAFGFRLRTPLLKQIVWNSPKIPKEARGEARSAGNALGQSYGMLNNRAAVDFFRKVWDSPYRLLIKPVALIHDAIYILVKNDIDALLFANEELIKSMQWQELPEIQHDTVKLGAVMEIYWPSWANPVPIPNNVDRATLINICTAEKNKIT